MHKGLYICMFSALLCGCSDPMSRVHTPGYEYVAATMDIGDLRTLYDGKTLNFNNNNIVVGGYVTANDKHDNFYRSFIIEDETGAVEIRAGMFDLHNIFTIGRRVAIMTNGLVLDSYNGVMQIGRPNSESGYGAEYIANRYYPGSYFRPQEDFLKTDPLLLSIGQLKEELCGRLIRITGLRFVEDEISGPNPTWAKDKRNTYHVFEDVHDRTITMLTSGYADFAPLNVPLGEVDITGILLKGNTYRKSNVFMIKMRSLDDVVEK